MGTSSTLIRIVRLGEDIDMTTDPPTHNIRLVLTDGISTAELGLGPRAHAAFVAAFPQMFSRAVNIVSDPDIGIAVARQQPVAQPAPAPLPEEPELAAFGPIEDDTAFAGFNMDEDPSSVWVPVSDPRTKRSSE